MGAHDITIKDNFLELSFRDEGKRFLFKRKPTSVLPTLSNFTLLRTKIKLLISN